MDIINSETIPLGQDPYEAVAYKKDRKQINIIYHDYVLPPVATLEDTYELYHGLTDKSWEMRQQTLAKLLESISNQDLDMQSKVTKEIFRLVTANLGHMVSSVRRLALEVVVAFIKHSKDSETVTKDLLMYAVDAAIVDSSVSLSTIQVLPTVLKHVQAKATNISHQLLAQIVTSLSKRMVQITHQRQVVASLLQIKGLVGNSMFDHFLETYYPQIKRDFDVLSNVYGHEYSDVSDFSDTEADSFFIQDSDVKDDDLNDENIDDDLVLQKKHVDRMNSGDDAVIMKVYDEDGNEIRRTSSRRVTFGGEIVKIRTPDSDATAAANGVKEKFDISADILIHVSSDESVKDGNDCVPVKTEDVKPELGKMKCSQIPLPIRPALNKPRYPGHKFQPFRQPCTELLNGSKLKGDQDLLMEIPNYEGESLTSSSDSSDRSRTRVTMNAANDQQKLFALKNNTIQDLTKMKINDKLVLENLFKKDDWGYYICAVERLSQILRQPFCIQSISSNMESNTGVSLLCYIFNTMSETKNNRVANSSLRVLRFLCQAMQSSTLVLYLSTIVPTFCSYLNSSHEYNVKLEAVEVLKMLMRKFSPQKMINILFTEQCFFSKSSKMRENSLLCLMYALITFPSTEFNVNEITETLIKRGINEPKRRVRQALLDTLSILGQLVPKYKFKVTTSDQKSMFFKKALQARLTRRQLPRVSQDGLILYAFQISSATAFGTDIEWILAGKGSLSDNFSKSKAQFNYVQADDISPMESRDRWTTSDKNSDNRVHMKKSLHTNVNNYIMRGSSEERLHTINKLYNSSMNNVERYSADWTDYRSSSSPFGYMHTRHPSNLSDTSSYESSYTSDQNFPRLNPGYEANSFYLGRPVSEDKLNRIPWSSKYSKLPLRLKPADCRISEYYGYNTSSSLPVLNDKKDTSFQHYYQTKKINCYSSDENRYKWTRISNEKQNKSKCVHENRTAEKIKSEDQIVESNENQKLQDGENWYNENNTLQDENEATIDLQSHSKEDIEDSKSDKKALDTIPKDEIQSPSDNKSKNGLCEPREKTKKFLEKKTGIRLKRSLTKEIKMPRSTFNLNPNDVAPFDQPKEALQKILLQFESNEWETIIEALQGVIRLTKHHQKQLAHCLHTYVIAVAKEIRSLRSQVARAACLSAESIFNNMSKISDQDIEELSHALLSRTADTNKFLRRDSNNALDAMVAHIKFSRSIIILTQKVVNSHPNALIRTSTARLLCRIIQIHGPARILSLAKEKTELVINTVVKFLMDSNLETRNQGKKIFQLLSKDRRMLQTLTEFIPNSVFATINKSLLRTNF